MHNRYLELDIPKMELLTLYAVQRVCFLSSLQSKSKTVLMVDVGKKGRGRERKKEKERKKKRKPTDHPKFILSPTLHSNSSAYPSSFNSKAYLKTLNISM